tara:strand:- start:18866 stop:19162 length:297 start_codon:yes stop_codon:yes gene_type:complete
MSSEKEEEENKDHDAKPMTEQMYIEMSKQLKEKYDEMEYLKVKLNDQNKDLKKEIITAYGMSRIIDNVIHQSFDIDSDIVTLCEALRGHLSNVIDEII